MKKGTRNLKEKEEGYMGEFEGRKEKVENDVIIISKRNSF